MQRTWEQIDKANICNNNFHSKSETKNDLRGLAFKIINHMKVIKQLRKDIAILKPDKGNGVVLLNNKNYTTSVGSLFKDTKTSRFLESDPTITRMKILQNYLSTLHEQNELTKEEYDTMRPKNGKLARAHGLPKIRKKYDNIPKFRPIVNTTGMPQFCWIVSREFIESTSYEQIHIERFI